MVCNEWLLLLAVQCSRVEKQTLNGVRQQAWMIGVLLVHWRQCAPHELSWAVHVCCAVPLLLLLPSSAPRAQG
jgi:hypothetical protein